MNKILTFSLLLFLNINLSSQIVVNPTNNAVLLAQKLLGSGVSITNVTFTGAVGSSGIFSQTNTPIQIDSGIVLTTGFVRSNLLSIGINGLATDDADSDNGAIGDAQLTALIGQPTNNASVLEFDFIPLGDTISFSYVFSSEEYPDYNCTNFNDVFGFFINGPGIAGTVNLATIPNTNPPIVVAINSINNGIPGAVGGGILSNCTSMGTGSPFTSFYINNQNGLQFSYNGLTRKLIAKARVIPCQVYHLKIAIADAVDRAFDSGVFLEANSLSSNVADMNLLGGSFDPSTNNIFLAEGCSSGNVNFTIPNTNPNPTSFNLVYSGTATNGVDATLLPNTITIPANTSSISLPITAFNDALNEGNEILKIYITSPCGNGTFLDSAFIEIRDYDVLRLTPSDSTFICNPGTAIQLSASNGYTTYTWDNHPSLNNLNIPNPIATPTVLPTTYYCTAIVGTCRSRDSLLVKGKEIISSNKVDILCKNDATGSINIVPGNSFSRPLQFALNSGTPQNDSSFTNLPVGNYQVTLTDNSGCVRNYPFSIVQLFPDLTFTESVVQPTCGLSNGTITFSASGGKAPYQYSLNGITYSTNNVLNTSAGNITLYVKDDNNCITTKTILVQNLNGPTLLNTNITPAGCSGIADGIVTVVANGGAPPLQYSSDGGTVYQLSNILTVTAGTKLITVKDNNGCTDTLTVLIPITNNLQLNAGNDTTICEGSSLQLNASSTGATHQWSPNIAISGSNTLNPLVSPISTTQYFILTQTGICTKLDSVTVTVRPAPLPNAGIDTTICYGKTIQLNGSGGTTYSWFPNSQIVNANTATPSINPLQNTTYWLHVEDIFNCKSLIADSIKVSIIPPIVMSAGRDTTIAQNQPLQLKGSGAPNYLWTPSTWLNNAAVANPIATIGTTGSIEYVLKGFTNEGCIGFDTLKVSIYKGPDIYVPTAFTPNRDGRNDILTIKAIGLKEFAYFRVFNRWGQIVFETKDPSVGWDGSFKGKQQPTGTFIWSVEGVDYLGNRIQKKGTVIVIK